MSSEKGEEERESESPDLSINLLLHPLFRSGVLFVLIFTDFGLGEKER